MEHCYTLTKANCGFPGFYITAAYVMNKFNYDAHSQLNTVAHAHL